MAKNNKQNGPKKEQPILLRCVTVGVAFVIFAGALGFKLSQLQIDEVDTWRARANNQQLDNVPIEPDRGTIYDINMKPMAKSATVWTVEASPDVLNKSKLDKKVTAETNPARLAAEELSKILDLDEGELYDKLKDKKKKYAKIKAKIEKPKADEVREVCKKYNLAGISLTEDSKRFYPYESLASTVLGFTNTDGDGVEGLESWYNEELKGTAGRSVALRNPWGGEINVGEKAMDYPPENGYSLVTTIDVEIQQVLEKYLAAAVTEHQARERGMGIVMNVNTFEIYGMATITSYDPNNPYEIFDPVKKAEIEAVADEEERNKLTGEARMLQWRNKALADTYEPGSVFKVITAAAAMDSGAFTEHSPFNCTSEIVIGDRTYHCAQNKAHGAIDTRQALIKSCNTSFIKMAEGMGVHTWYSYLNAFGMTEPTGVDLGGEPSQRAINNLVHAEKNMGAVELASSSFGQSNKYTALQMISAVSAAVNGGNLMQPHFVKQILDSEGNVVENIQPVVKRQVISPETSAILCSAMEELVSGTEFGSSAYVAGYHVGGKSGTSQKLEILNKENREAYISSFLAFAPANKPEIAVLIALDEPEDNSGLGTYFGTRLAGPTAANVIQESLKILGVEADISSEEEAARQTISTPKLTERDVESATATLTQEGLEAVIVGEGKTILAQSPAAYTQIPNGGQVFLYTESETTQENITVPDFNRQSAKAAIESARKLGFNVLTTGAPDSASGVVVGKQDLEPGTEVVKGSIIKLTMVDTTSVGE